ncbi:MAG: DUF2085 domain-containing protein [archaeon]
MGPLRRLHWSNWGDIFLKIVFCHALPGRCFSFRGHSFPLCARCTGILLGIPFGYIVNNFFLHEWGIGIFLMMPLILDGFIQVGFHYESTNVRRLVTGVVFTTGMFLFIPELMALL